MPELHNPIEQAIEYSIKIPSEQRPYLGYSILGNPCGRYLWYNFRWFYKEEITPRLNRLFNRGHQEEAVVVEDLRRVGVQCTNVLDEQVEVVGAFGHIKGHPDGEVLGIPGAEKTQHLLEIKTANDKKFTEFVKFGVQRSNPKYYIQVQAYMHHRGLKRCLFVITNKNDDTRHYERIEYVEQDFQDAEDKGIDIILSPVPMPKLSESKEWYECKWCAAYDVCHEGKAPERNCRTCSNSSIKENGEWGCSVYPEKPIPVEFQRKGCAEYYRPIV